MILATRAILMELHEGRIVCDPLPERIEGAHIDVRLGEHSWLFRAPRGLLRLRDADPREHFTHRHNTDEITIPPRGFVLAHTEEFIGTTKGSGLTPYLHTRSTFARWGLSVCTANAGQGDEGYCSRWTLEIINPHPCAVTIPVGARIGSVSFVETTSNAADYPPDTRYNHTRDTWTPDAMLPRRGNW